ncbi:MAG: long-chain fatty acid--CoA ligase, partial [Spirochaetaceae bacterium]|nr:long-chain fatty acid--CoA ligase [Spirochaetaceae bacterium]
MKTMNQKTLPWSFLDQWRGKAFKGEWPTIPEMFRITVERYSERPCFTDFDPEKQTLLYREVLEKVEILARWLCSQGIEKGDRVAVSGKNSPEWTTVYLATLFAGGIIVPIDYGLHDAEIENLIKASEPKILFIDEEKFEHFSKTAGKMNLYSLNKKHPDVYAYNLKTDRPCTLPQASEEDTAAILFTSGTTGIPKGVMLSHKNLVSDCYIAQTRLTIYSTDVFYALLPLHHSYTMLAVFIESMSVGAEVVFGKTMAVSRMLKELREGKITMLLG